MLRSNNKPAVEGQHDDQPVPVPVPAPGPVPAAPQEDATAALVRQVAAAVTAALGVQLADITARLDAVERGRAVAVNQLHASSVSEAAGPPTPPSASIAASSAPDAAEDTTPATTPHFITARKEPACSFNGAADSHPLEFIDELERHFQDGRVPPAVQLHQALDCLRGNAHQWALTLRRRGQLHSYADLREALKREYWTEDRQDLAKLEFFRARYHQNTGVSMAEWLITWSRRAQFLDPPLPERTLVLRIAQHYPDPVCQALLAMPDLREDDMRAYLRRLDSAKRWKAAMAPDAPTGVSAAGAPGPPRGAHVHAIAVETVTETDLETPAAAHHRSRSRRKDRVESVTAAAPDTTTVDN